MKTAGNVAWLILFGWELVIAYALSGALCCLTIVFIPVGMQFFKATALAAWPMGYDIRFSSDPGATILNIIWALLGGWETFLSHAALGCLLCLTVIGIPFGLQMFKIGKLFLMPIGAEIVPQNK